MNTNSYYAVVEVVSNQPCNPGGSGTGGGGGNGKPGSNPALQQEELLTQVVAVVEQELCASGGGRWIGIVIIRYKFQHSLHNLKKNNI